MLRASGIAPAVLSPAGVSAPASASGASNATHREGVLSSASDDEVGGEMRAVREQRSQKKL